MPTELAVRRVVTGHDAQGRAIIVSDALSETVISRRPGHASAVIWSTATVPADNDDPADGAARAIATADPNGTVFRVVRYDPGVGGRLHRTASIDYAVVLSGEIELHLDGDRTTLRAGDVLVQRGTIHDWANRGTVPCLVAFVLVAARPATAGGRGLEAEG
jgi:quercetin dioxygenase-like cupin family protein